jgi:TATA element modulatory factor
VSRSSSTARKNDRLQERLARAVVKPAAFTNAPSQTASSLSSKDISDSARVLNAITDPTKPGDESRALSPASRSHDSFLSLEESKELFQDKEDGPRGIATAENVEDRNEVQVEEHEVGELEVETEVTSNPELGELATHVEPDSRVAELLIEHRAAEQRWQEEMHDYIERIDALQSKLKYLANEAVESAKKAAASVEPGSMQKQLFEKEERIALLLEEGRRLSKTELDNRTIIKKLRQVTSAMQRLGQSVQRPRKEGLMRR